MHVYVLFLKIKYYNNPNDYESKYCSKYFICIILFYFYWNFILKYQKV